MPVGRLIQTSDLRDLAERGLAGERVYLKGQFVVNFTEPYRAVLRPRTRLTDAVLHPLGGGPAVRIVVNSQRDIRPLQEAQRSPGMKRVRMRSPKCADRATVS
jgi:hypothetical protein